MVHVQQGSMAEGEQLAPGIDQTPSSNHIPTHVCWSINTHMDTHSAVCLCWVWNLFLRHSIMPEEEVRVV